MQDRIKLGIKLPEDSTGHQECNILESTAYLNKMWDESVPMTQGTVSTTMACSSGGKWSPVSSRSNQGQASGND